MLKRLFTEHPASVDETYREHFSVASYYGVRMLFGGMACMVHAVFPFLCLTTGSATINRLQKHMTERTAAAGVALEKSAPAGSPIPEPGARQV